MITQNKITSIKSFLFLVAGIFAVAAILLIILSASAAGEGGTPAEAIPLPDDGYEGTLGPSEQHWFSFMVEDQAGAGEVEKSLSLTFSPNDGNMAQYVGLNVFEQDQIQLFAEDDTSQMAGLGVTQIVTPDADSETGELFWSASVAAANTYYIQVLNDSDFSIDYRLFSAAISAPPPVEPETDEAEAAPAADVAAPSDVAAPQLGSDPGNPAPLSTGLNRGVVPPHSTYWYNFQYDDFSGENRFKELDFSMFFTPDDGNRRHHVNFELFPASEYEIWRRGDGDKLTNFGAGMLDSRDGDYNTGERTWRGVVIAGDSYLMSIENGTDVEIEYWLFDDDIYYPELGPKPATEPATVFAAGAAPQTATPLKLGLNKGGLEPGEEAWYSFRVTDFDEEFFEEMGLTMIATPDDGNRIRNMTFDVFTADGAKNWSPGDNSQIDNVGAGSVVYRDDNPLTGERFWSGWVVDNDLYLVQVRNGAEVHMDYWLYTGDVYSPELGQKTVPKAMVFEPGTAPTVPEPLAVGVNEGQLKPKEEQWYVFSRGDVDDTGSVETVFTMIFTPDDGNRIRDINFELFEGNQLRDWGPDNRFNLKNFGQGSVVSRDGGLETGELLWKGHVMANDLYYMRVSNESDVTIDYRIHPDDVIKTDLEQQ